MLISVFKEFKNTFDLNFEFISCTSESKDVLFQCFFYPIF